MNSGFQDPYLIPGTNVLINKLNLTDNYELSIQEERLSKRRANELAAQGITGEFDLDHFKSIHQYLFQDVYDWAGETRVVNISKGGTVFESASRIGAATYGIHRVLEQENFLVDLERVEFAQGLAKFYKMWNAVHPFREGNGRATRMLMGQLAANAGWMLDVQRIENGDGQWNEASKRSFNGDLALVAKVFEHAVRDPRAVLFERAEREAALRIYPDLEGAFKALDTVQKTLQDRGVTPEKQGIFMETFKNQIGAKLDAGVRHFDNAAVSQASIVALQSPTMKIKR